jgi:hypothetical protein
VGCVLTGANPGLWVPFFVALFKIAVPFSFFIGLGFLEFGFALILPGALMWLLTVRRAHSHDAYDLFKPPLVAFILLLILTIVMLSLKIDFTVTITHTDPLSNVASGIPGQSGSAESIMQTSLSSILLLGSVLSFLGVEIAELGSRIKKRMMF